MFPGSATRLLSCNRLFAAPTARATNAIGEDHRGIDSGVLNDTADPLVPASDSRDTNWHITGTRLQVIEGTDIRFAQTARGHAAVEADSAQSRGWRAAALRALSEFRQIVG